MYKLNHMQPTTYKRKDSLNKKQKKPSNDVVLNDVARKDGV